MKNKENQKQHSEIGNLIELIPYLKPYKKDIFLVIIALIITTAMILFLGKAIQHLIDLGFVSGENNHLSIILGIFILAIVILAIAGYFRSSLIHNVGEKVVTDLRRDVYSHIIKVSSEFFEITKIGDVISRLTVDTTLLYNIISSSISFFIRNFLLFIGGIIFLFVTSPKLTLISIGIIPIAIAPVMIMGKKIRGLSNQSQAAIANVGSHIEESVSGIKTIQSYICEEKEIRNFDKYLRTSLDIALKRIKMRSLLVALVIIFAFGSIATVLLVGGNEVISGRMSSGTLSSFIFYAVLTATSLVSISQITSQLQTAGGATARLFELLSIKSPVTEIERPEKLTNLNEIKIKFEDVNFCYPSRKDNLAVKNFNLEIKPQEKISLVGSSGSGKSTLFQLLMRFYDVNSGSILINDHNISNLAIKDLRDLFSYISQDSFIFSGTVFENIAYADNNVSREQVEKIIAENEALAFINDLPLKLDSFVGEKGIKLSGGEKQRISIARAIIKDSPILLLDEATSALDNKNEQIIHKAIADIAENKTVIAIAHKLSSVLQSDRIIFIKNGEIVEWGNHKELIKQDGLYAKMYEFELSGLKS